MAKAGEYGGYMPHDIPQFSNLTSNTVSSALKFNPVKIAENYMIVTYKETFLPNMEAILVK